ncbi:unnamed protein product [Lampetra planeri]
MLPARCSAREGPRGSDTGVWVGVFARRGPFYRGQSRAERLLIGRGGGGGGGGGGGTAAAPRLCALPLPHKDKGPPCRLNRPVGQVL